MPLIRAALRRGGYVPFPRGFRSGRRGSTVRVRAAHVIKRPLTDVAGTHNGTAPSERSLGDTARPWNR